MTFSNGVNTVTGTAQEITEASIKLIVQAIVTLAVIGAWIYCIVTNNPNASEFTVPVITVIGAWFGQSAAELWLQGKRTIAQVEMARLRSGPGVDNATGNH